MDTDFRILQCIIGAIFFIIFIVEYIDKSNKIKINKTKKGIVEKVELINTSKKKVSWYSSKHTILYKERYKLTVKLEDGREIETNIRRIGGGGRYSWIPQKGDSIIIYKNEDGSYENNYREQVLKERIISVFIVFGAFLILLIIFYLFYIHRNKALFINFKSNTSDYTSYYDITCNSKSKCIIKYEKKSLSKSNEVTYQQKQVSKKDVKKILIKHKKDYNKQSSYHICTLYYKTKDEEYCLKLTEDTEKYFDELLNKN